MVGTQQRSFAGPRPLCVAFEISVIIHLFYIVCHLWGNINQNYLLSVGCHCPPDIYYGRILKVPSVLTGDANVISKTRRRSSVLLQRYFLYRHVCHGTGMSPCGDCVTDKSRFNYVRDQRFLFSAASRPALGFTHSLIQYLC